MATTDVSMKFPIRNLAKPNQPKKFSTFFNNRAHILWLGALATILLLALVGCFAWGRLPVWLQDHANKKFSEIPDYRVHIGAVGLHPLHGAFSVKDVSVYKTAAKIPVPLFFADDIAVSFLWSQLIRGRVLLNVAILQPHVHIVDDKNPVARQTGEGQPWVKVMKEMVPFDVERLKVENGRFTFHNFSSKPEVRVEADQINLEAHNLTNNRDFSGSLIANANLKARLLEHAPLEVLLRANPLAEQPEFEMTVRVNGLQLKKLNDLTRAYAKVDIETGTLEMLAEAKSKNGFVDAYAKPYFRDLKIMSWQGDVKRDGDNPVRLAWEGFAGFVKEMFENQAKEQVATRISLSGPLADPKADLLSAVGGFLKNAFVRAMAVRFDWKVTVSRNAATR